MKQQCLSIIAVAISLSFVFCISDLNAGGRSKKITAPVPRTGQTDSYYTGDDGGLQVGVLGLCQGLLTMAMAQLAIN